jgi:hypothetical protein
MGADDGMEFFGGTVDVRNIVITGANDDSFDWVNGWQGRAQYIVVKKYGDEGNNGIEADNLDIDHNATPRSGPTISNATFIGSHGLVDGYEGGAGVLVRRGTGARIYNSIITGFKQACIDIDDEATFQLAYTRELFFRGCLIGGCLGGSFDEEDTDLYPVSTLYFAYPNREASDLGLDNYKPVAGSPALTGAELPPDTWFDSTTYVGAMGLDNDWTAGWTIGLDRDLPNE